MNKPATRVDPTPPIVTEPSVVLQRPADPYPLEDLGSDDFRELVDHMRRAMDRADGVGIAAPQIGRSVRVALIDLDHTGTPRVLVNPVIERAGGMLVTEVERCLSCPGHRVRVKRATKVDVAWWELRDGELRKVFQKFVRWPARVVQHELEHLNGRLITDHEGADE